MSFFAPGPLGEDKDGLLGPQKDKYNVCSLLDKYIPVFGSRQIKTANSARLLDIKTEVRALCGNYLIYLGRRYALI